MVLDPLMSQLSHHGDKMLNAEGFQSIMKELIVLLHFDKIFGSQWKNANPIFFFQLKKWNVEVSYNLLDFS